MIRADTSCALFQDAIKAGCDGIQAHALAVIIDLISAMEPPSVAEAGAGSDGLAVRKSMLLDLTLRNGTRTSPAVPSGICK